MMGLTDGGFTNIEHNNIALVGILCIAEYQASLRLA